MLKKNDPLADVVKGIMHQTSLRKQIEEKLHDELGIQSRKQIPHELVGKYDSMLAEAQKESLEEAPEKLVKYKGQNHRVLHIHNTAPRNVTSMKHDESKIGWLNIVPVPHKGNRWPDTVSPFDPELEAHPSHPEVLAFAQELAKKKESLKEGKKDMSLRAYFDRKDKRDGRAFEKQDQRYAAKANRKYKKLTRDTIANLRKELPDDKKESLEEERDRDIFANTEKRDRRKDKFQEIRRANRYLSDVRKRNKEEKQDHADYPHESKVSDVKADHSKKSDKDYHKDINEGILSNIKNRLTGKRRSVMKKIDKKIEDKHNEAGEHASRKMFSNDILGIGQLARSFQDLHTTALKTSSDPKNKRAGNARDLAIRWARKRKEGNYPSFKKEEVEVNEAKASAKVRRAKLTKKLNDALDNRQKELGVVTQADKTGKNSPLDKDPRYKTLHDRYMKVAWPIKEEQTQPAVPALRKPMQQMQPVAPVRPSPVAPVPAAQPAITASPQAAAPATSPTIAIKPATEAAKKPATKGEDKPSITAAKAPTWATAKAPTKK